MRLRAVRPFRWAGDHVEPGSELTVDDREARQILDYGDAVVVEDTPPRQPVSASVVDGDPVAQHRDPVRRRR